MTYLLAKCSGKWGNIAGYANNSLFAQHRTHCCDIVCWIIVNSYIVRFKKNKSIIHWTTWFYFLIQIGCRMVAGDILHLTIKVTSCGQVFKIHFLHWFIYQLSLHLTTLNKTVTWKLLICTISQGLPKWTWQSRCYNFWWEIFHCAIAIPW